MYVPLGAQPDETSAANLFPPQRPAGPRPGEVLRALGRARRTLPLYGPDHPVTVQALDEVHGIVEELLDRVQGTRGAVKFFIHEDTFYAGKTALLEESLRYGAMLTDFAERQIGIIEFQQGVEVRELRSLVEVLNIRPAELHGLGGAAVQLEKRGVRHIAVGPASSLRPEDQSDLRVDPRDVYRAGLRVIDDLYYQASRDVPLELKKASVVVNSLVEAMATDKFALLGLAALKNYDQDTCHHAINVSILSLMLGLHLQLSKPLVVTLGVSAMLHDVGKVRIPRDILIKHGTFTPEERELVKRHPLYGAHLLRNVPGLARLAMVVAFEHHANYNLSGYPQITAKQGPHLLTRMVHVADFFDAATSSRRPYKRPMLPSEAMRFILDGAGREFDPFLGRVFVQVLGLYPVGSVVALDTGELAVVTRPNEREFGRPEVKVFKDRSGQSILPYALNLEEAREREIVRELDPTETTVDVEAHLQN